MPNKLDGLKIAQDIATQRGGWCLSDIYVNSKEKIQWKCATDHVWWASLNNIKDKESWCPECSGNTKYSLNFCKEIARNKNGKCLSYNYVNLYHYMKWKCQYGHIWSAKFTTIINDDCWCPICAGNKKLDGITIANQIAEKRGGKCLSNLYINGKSKLLWQCEKKHIWYATLNKVKDHNQWCKECGFLKAAIKSNNSYIIYHWKTNEEIVCVGSYEKAVVEYLNKNKINFKWQSKVFTTTLLTKSGKYQTYRPDLYLTKDKKWVEIKGYFRSDALEKWDWFQKNYPNSELWDKTKLKNMGVL